MLVIADDLLEPIVRQMWELRQAWRNSSNIGIIEE